MSFARWIENLPWVVELTGNAVEISIVWLFHFLGFFLVIGTTVLIDLRVLGVAAKRLKIGQLVEQFSLWTWVGLIFAFASGFLMFAGYAVNELAAPIFQLKIILFFVAALVGFLVQKNGAKWDNIPTPPAGAKFLAVLSIVLWIGLILLSVEVPAFIACI